MSSEAGLKPDVHTNATKAQNGGQQQAGISHRECACRAAESVSFDSLTQQSAG
jgi:hypothetical protein